MGMLVLSDIFCTFSRNTKLPNFGNIFREKYSSYFYKQGVIYMKGNSIYKILSPAFFI